MHAYISLYSCLFSANEEIHSSILRQLYFQHGLGTQKLYSRTEIHGNPPSAYDGLAAEWLIDT